MRKDGWFAVIDEGPGLSGSSICGTLEKLLECGISKDRIVIFPSWNPDSGRFISERAKRLWPIFDKFTKDFTDVWIVNNKLESLFEKKIINDFSGGNWRDFLISNKSDFPAVYTFHERRKYLLEDEHKNQYIAKWVGLGEYGEKLIERGSRMAGSQFGIPITSYTYGFIIQPFIKGKILQVSDANGVFLEFVANYFHFLDKNFRSSLTAPFEKMIEMADRLAVFPKKVEIQKALGESSEAPSEISAADSALRALAGQKQAAASRISRYMVDMKQCPCLVRKDGTGFQPGRTVVPAHSKESTPRDV
jgi:hypothetical protein